MNIRTLLLGIITFIAIGNHAQTTKYVGGDVSMLPKYEEANVAYYDINGTKIENGKLLEFFRDDAGFNIVRVRLFVNPTGEDSASASRMQASSSCLISIIVTLGQTPKNNTLPQLGLV